MKKFIPILIVVFLSTVSLTHASVFDWINNLFNPSIGAPALRYERTILPETTGTYNLGSLANKWLNVYTNFASTTAISGTTVCIGSDCQTAWPAGGGGTGVGTISTSTAPTLGQLSYWTSSGAWPETLGKVATTSLTATSPLSLSQPISVIGSSASALSVNLSGYVPYTGATDDVDLGAYNLTTAKIISSQWIKSTTEAPQITLARIDGGLDPDWDKVTIEATSGTDTDMDLVVYGKGTGKGVILVYDSSRTKSAALFHNGTNLVWNSTVGDVQLGNVAELNLIFGGELVSDNSIKILDPASNIYAIFDTSLLTTTDKTFTFPDKSLTFAGINNETFTGLTTFGNASTTLLSIGTQLWLGTATTTGTNGIDISGGCFAVNGTCITGGAGGGWDSLDDISLTKGYFIVGGDDSKAQATSSIFISSQGNVGIGTTAPGSPLDIKNTVINNDIDGIRWGYSDSYYNSFSATFEDDEVGNNMGFNVNTGFGTGRARVMTLRGDGNVGIGTTSPYAKLSVVGETVAAYFTATTTTASTFPYASTTALTVSGTLYPALLGGVIDAGGAISFEIPNDANPTVDATGEVAINSTAASSSLRYYDGTAERALYPEYDKAFSFASSTLAYMGSYSTTGTTTILLINHLRPITLTRFYCKTDVGTAFVRFGDGTNYTTEGQCSTTGVEVVPASNNTWIMREDFKIQIGTQATNPNMITVTATIRENAD